MRRKSKKILIVSIVYYSLLFLFTSFVLLLEFVIPHGGIVIDDPLINIPDPEETTEALVYPGIVPTALQAGTILGSYETDSVLITVYQIRAYDSDIFVADVVAKDAYTILSALAFNTFGGTNIVQEVSTMAEAHDAIFAINSDYASHYSSGYVIRNGAILRSTASYRDAVVLNTDGTVTTITEESENLNDILDGGAWQLWSFGPVLVKDGLPVSSIHDGLDRDAVNNPRSAFGYVDVNHFMFVCVDGRTDASFGVDIEELSFVMLSLGCTQAYNFDGGGSATMWFNNEVINHPSEGSERKVGDCVYISK